jgi:hypothetical protein
MEDILLAANSRYGCPSAVIVAGSPRQWCGRASATVPHHLFLKNVRAGEVPHRLKESATPQDGSAIAPMPKRNGVITRESV